MFNPYDYRFVIRYDTYFTHNSDKGTLFVFERKDENAKYLSIDVLLNLTTDTWSVSGRPVSGNGVPVELSDTEAWLMIGRILVTREDECFECTTTVSDMYKRSIKEDSLAWCSSGRREPMPSLIA